MDTVTVILPTYNRSSLLQRAIKSLRSQTWKNQRICIRDDCSTDNSVERIQQWITVSGLNVTLHLHEKNQGITNINY